MTKRETPKKELVLVHGWDPRVYSKRLKEKSVEVAWSRRERLVKELKKRYKVSFFNLPGFAGEPEPNKEYFELWDFEKVFVQWLKKNQKEKAILLGYSFGGAVVLKTKVDFGLRNRVILISPAIKRAESIKSEMGGWGKRWLPRAWVERGKHLYQYLFSKYYRLGSSFLRLTYDRIVRDNLTEYLIKVKREDLLLIYGESDRSTPFDLVKKIVKKAELKYELIVGGHNIGETAPKEIVDVIESWAS